MKSPTTASVAVLCLMLAGCVGTNAPGTDSTSTNRISELEQKVETLERRLDDQSRKVRIFANVFGSPIDNFFAEEGWWENPYDAGQAECSKSCIAALQTHRQACAAMQDEDRRLACYNEAVTNASTCHRRCQGRFPPPRN